MSIITFLIAVFGVQGITQFYKSAQEKYTPSQIHMAVGLLSLLAAGILHQFGHNESFITFLKTAGEIFAGAVTIYNTVWKEVGKFINSPLKITDPYNITVNYPQDDQAGE